ncbi:MAG: GSCFA domain-containing protein [Salinivirgaceae bacterium]|jgi:hypothetical protein|nr:GSCFA domain-containing protein [Salinivirgaceae bacterium]
MDNFRTTFQIPENQNKISYNTPILSIGSCFSENIGAKLSYYKFPVTINPFGILYNPESIANSIDLLLENKVFQEGDLFEHQGVWNSFNHHSRFSSMDRKECLEKINHSLANASTQLKNIDVLMLTFGTAWVYQEKKSGAIVSNCHKVAAKEFNRFKLSVSDIVERYSHLFSKLRSQNPQLKIIITVSPVRHLKDGAAENLLSKASLIMAVHELVAKFENVSYFPSYEIMMDDLRDYRFYANDMIHPAPLAINYIWEKFKNACIKNNSQSLMLTIDKINQALMHKPFQPKSDSHQKFLKSTLSKIEEIERKNATIFFEQEKLDLLNQID